MNKIVYICDECGEELDTEEGDYNEAWEIAKENGWRCWQDGDEWKHECEDCNDRNKGLV
jgi:DNA-directed RNA polymerase subunit RPC12/RpoP